MFIFVSYSIFSQHFDTGKLQNAQSNNHKKSMPAIVDDETLNKQKISCRGPSLVSPDLVQQQQSTLGSSGNGINSNNYF